MRFLLVRLYPKDMRSKESINLGFEIIKEAVESCGWDLNTASFGDKIDKTKYDIIGFNIFYITHQYNLIPFLKENDIAIHTEQRKKAGDPILIAGGQGVQNPRPLSRFIDFFVIGDGELLIKDLLGRFPKYDFNEMSKVDGYFIPNISKEVTFSRINEIISEPIIYNKRAVIKLTRGCLFRCNFCQYGWSSGKYREKDFELVKKQIKSVLNQGVRNINVMSCNLGGYSHLENLLKFCIDNKVRLTNSDIRPDQYVKYASLFDKLKIRTVKVGLESFSEKIRKLINKKITDQQLDEFFETAIKYTNNIHFYLIYGLPIEEDYKIWFDYIKKFKNRIKSIQNKKIRLEFSITNFEPALFTPYENSPFICFDKKDTFLKDYLKVLEDIGAIEDASKKDYKNMHGRIGRKKEPYLVTMYLLHGDESCGNVLEKLDIKGITRSIKPNVLDKIQKLIKKELDQ